MNRSILPYLGAAVLAMTLYGCDSAQEDAREDRVEQKADQMEDRADTVRDQGEAAADTME